MADFEKVIRKHANEDGSIPADAIQGLAQAIAKYVGENFVDVARYNTKKNLADELQEKVDASEKLQGDYDKLKKDFDDYKNDQAAKALHSEKEAAFKEVLTKIGVPEKRFGVILRSVNLDEKTYDFADGKFKDASAVEKQAKDEWSDFSVTTKETGVDTAKPPVGNGSKTVMTKDEIMAIKDTATRQQAIADNHELFGF